MLERRILDESYVWLLGSLCNLHRVPFDAALVQNGFAPPYTLVSFLEAAQLLGFKAGTRTLPEDGWDKLPRPFIVFLKDETSKAEGRNSEFHTADVPESGVDSTSRASHENDHEAAATLLPVFVLKVENQKLVYHRPGLGTPETLAFEEAAARLEQQLVLVAREAGAANDEDGENIAGFEIEKPKFGFRWFVPELLKHKKIWRDVVLASFAIQLVGLAIPVFTQVIIDKVVVH